MYYKLNAITLSFVAGNFLNRYLYDGSFCTRTSYISTVHPSTILRIFNQFIMKFSKWFNHESSSAHICPSFLISSFYTRLILINISKRLMMWYDVNGIWSKASHFTASSHRFLFHGTHFGGILVTSRKKNIERFRTSQWYEMAGSEQERHMWERRAAVDVSIQYNIHFQWKYGTSQLFIHKSTRLTGIAFWFHFHKKKTSFSVTFLVPVGFECAPVALSLSTQFTLIALHLYWMPLKVADANPLSFAFAFNTNDVYGSRIKLKSNFLLSTLFLIYTCSPIRSEFYNCLHFFPACHQKR